MRGLSLLVACWPGLPQILHGARWRSLAAALGFSLLLNLALVSTWIWSEWLHPRMVAALWLAVGGFWLISVSGAVGISLRSGPSSSVAAAADLFRRAQTEYLRGNWFEAESTLLELLHHQSGDAEARLMLASLYRRNRRPADAERQLRYLESLETGLKWQWEIAQERRWLAELTEDAGNIGDEAGTSSKTGPTGGDGPETLAARRSMRVVGEAA